METRVAAVHLVPAAHKDDPECFLPRRNGQSYDEDQRVAIANFSFNLVILAAGRKKSELEGKLIEEKAWSSYETKLQQDEHKREDQLYELVNHPQNHPQNVFVDHVTSGCRTLERVFISTYGAGLLRIVEAVKEKRCVQRLPSKRTGFLTLDFLMSKKLRQVFLELIVKPLEKDFESEKSFKKESRHLEKKSSSNRLTVSFLLLAQFLKKRQAIDKNYFFTRFIISTKSKVDLNVVRNLDRLIHKMILVRVGRAFNMIQTSKKKPVYTGENISNFCELIEMLVANRLKPGFDSIRSYVIQLEILVVKKMSEEERQSELETRWKNMETAFEKLYKAPKPTDDEIE